VLKLEAELLQQQQEERRDRQRQPARDVGGEQNKLPGGEAAEGDGASVDPPGERRRASSERWRTTLSVASVWKRSGWPSEAMATMAAESRRTRMQRGAENSKAKGRSSSGKCESVTAARGVNPFSRKTPPLAPQDATENLARHAPKQPSL
jgi:hypothetical protein